MGLSSLLSAGLGLPLEGIVNQGPQLGPLTPAHGDLVQTPRGLASIHLEGFSEDLNEDGYVDPVAQAVAAPVVQAAAPVAVAAAAPAAVYTQQYAQPAPALTYTVPHHQVAHTGLHAANVAVAPVAQVAGHAHGLCHNHLGSAVPCAL